MSDFEDKLNAILSSPDTMAQVAAIAQQLTGGGETASTPPPPQQTNTLPQDLFSGIDPSMIMQFLPLLQEINSPVNDQRAALLHALRPFLKPDRQEKVDRALQAAHMLQIGRKLLGHLGDKNV